MEGNRSPGEKGLGRWLIPRSHRDGQGCEPFIGDISEWSEDYDLEALNDRRGLPGKIKIVWCVE